MMENVSRVLAANTRTDASPEVNEFRVLILAPTRNDARLTSQFLQQTFTSISAGAAALYCSRKKLS
jgi:hypothetical protein